MTTTNYAAGRAPARLPAGTPCGTYSPLKPAGKHDSNASTITYRPSTQPANRLSSTQAQTDAPTTARPSTEAAAKPGDTGNYRLAPITNWTSSAPIRPSWPITRYRVSEADGSTNYH